jgi:CubicO group peptidase (beta-lactamase class C family)
MGPVSTENRKSFALESAPAVSFGDTRLKTGRHMARCTRYLAALLLLFAVPAIAESLKVTKPERVGMSSAKLQELQDYFQKQVSDGLEPGFQVIVARRGRVVMHENMGYMDVRTREPITYDTLFRIMSMTKPITNVAAMILYEEGRFSLDDPIAKFIPELAELTVYAGTNDAGEMILEPPRHAPTMHELMTHTAGFTYGGPYSSSPVNEIYQQLRPFEHGIDRQEAIDRLSRIPLAYQPGTEYIYSYSADILGIVVENISGSDLGAFMQARIFDPLGMDETVSWVPPELEPRLMKIHRYDEQGKLAIFADDPDSARPIDRSLVKPAIFNGGGQLISTPGNYFRFAQMLLNGGVFDEVRILSPSTVQLMTTQRYPVGVRERYWAPGQGHGLNVSVVIDPTQINYPTSKGEFSHGGLANGYFFVDPEEELVVIMQGQLFPPRYRNMHIPIVNALVHAAIVE